MKSVTGFHEQYMRLMRLLLTYGVTMHNARTGHDVLVIRGGHSLVLEMSGGVIPVPGTRKVYPKSAAAELAWWTTGSQSVKFISKYAPLWDKFTEDDGDTIAAAYGYRWRRHFGRDQLKLCVDQLYSDPSDRQVVVCAWDPGSDAMGSVAKKNVPCPLLFQVYSLPKGGDRREVCMNVTLRSSDTFVGLPYDVLGYSLLQQAIVTGLNDMRMTRQPTEHPTNRWVLGTLKLDLAHAHLYDSHFRAASDMLAVEHEFVEPFLPKSWSLEDIEKAPDLYVEAVGVIQKGMKQPDFDFRPEVIE